MSRIKGRTYNGETVSLDGIEFVGCTFLDCVFKWNGGPYKFDDGTAFGGFRAVVTDNQQIADTVSMLKGFRLLEREFAENWQRSTNHYLPTIKKAS
jgi:hypothetical protein